MNNPLGGTRTQCGCERSSAWAALPPIFCCAKKSVARSATPPLRKKSCFAIFFASFLCRWHIFSEQQRDGSLRGVELAAFQRNAGRPSKRAIVGASCACSDFFVSQKNQSPARRNELHYLRFFAKQKISRPFRCSSFFEKKLAVQSFFRVFYFRIDLRGSNSCIVRAFVGVGWTAFDFLLKNQRFFRPWSLFGHCLLQKGLWSVQKGLLRILLQVHNSPFFLSQEAAGSFAQFDRSYGIYQDTSKRTAIWSICSVSLAKVTAAVFVIGSSMPIQSRAAPSGVFPLMGMV